MFEMKRHTSDSKEHANNRVPFGVALVLLVLFGYSTAYSIVPPAKYWYSFGLPSAPRESIILNRLDTSRFKHQALVCRYLGKKNVTFGFRYLGDSLSAFDWPIVMADIAVADVNSDGIVDYCHNFGETILPGTQIDSLPSSDIRIFPLLYTSSSPTYVGDFNADSTVDLLRASTTEPTNTTPLGQLRSFNKTLDTVMRLPIRRTDDSKNSYEKLIDIYVAPDRSVRATILKYFRSQGTYSEQKVVLCKVNIRSLTDPTVTAFDFKDEVLLQNTGDISTVGAASKSFHSVDNSVNLVSFGWPESNVYDVSNGNFRQIAEGSLAEHYEYLPELNKYVWTSYVKDASITPPLLAAVVCVGVPGSQVDSVMQVPICNYDASYGGKSNFMRMHFVMLDSSIRSLTAVVIYSDSNIASRGPAIVCYRNQNDVSVLEENTVTQSTEMQLKQAEILPTDGMLRLEFVNPVQTTADVLLYDRLGKYVGQCGSISIRSSSRSYDLPHKLSQLTQGIYEVVVVTQSGLRLTGSVTYFR